MAGNSQVKATITNNGKNNLKIFRAGTILDKAAIEKASVTADSNPVKFIGIRQRLATSNLKETAFEHIPAGQAITVTFDVAHVHDLSSGGKFDIETSGVLNFADEASTELVGSVPYFSNKITADIDGEQAAASRLDFTNTKRTKIQSDCKAQKLTATNSALKNCASLSQKASQAASSGSAAKLEEYFKSSTSAVRQQVAGVFNKVAKECGSTSSGVSRYYCSDVDNGCEDGVLAYTLPSQSFMAYCDLYFNDLPGLTSRCHAQDQATTTLHEVTHLSEIAGTEDNGYGYNAIRKLSSRASLNNADSYAMYANAIYSNC
ncbi:Deuterolysin [Cladobotryum mycophilum]|uniref:Neutral protease 2 n=1 Tax=Cladobotryum mycophilum TaxID=491253 RepID=A0ABR0SH74_9HYPO